MIGNNDIVNWSKKSNNLILIVEDEENEDSRVRQMSEFNNANKGMPIPPASSFFIFSPTNRRVKLLIVLLNLFPVVILRK